MLYKSRTFLWVLTLVIGASIVVAGCGGAEVSQEAQSGFSMAPLAGMPLEVQNAPVAVRQAYQFALANPEVLSQIPCYCGCGGMGHTSNYSCYVAGQDTDGSLRYDGHALGCSICVDITQDTMRLLNQGKTVPEIRAYVDQVYARFGPSNMP